jgi:hypothetical protein
LCCRLGIFQTILLSPFLNRSDRGTYW